MKAAERIKEILAWALERRSPAEREKYLAEACWGEPELRREMKWSRRCGRRTTRPCLQISGSVKYQHECPAGNANADSVER